jgi:aryl-phospho-beta-D-glucosidase BglC (GH1 family)
MTRTLSTVLLLFATVSAFTQTSTVADARFNHLRHGINASEWFAQRGEYPRSFLETYTTAQDFSLMRQMGFDHVRLSIDPQPIWRERRADELPSNDFLTLLDRTVDAMLAQGLAVIVDIHPSSEFKRRVNTEEEFDEEFADFWRGLARHYANRNPDLVFFEVENEPEANDGFRWMGVQAMLVAAIRQGAPNNTIIASAHHYSDIVDLLLMEPVADRNVIYNFHYYDSHTFTHQGATWGSNYWHYLKDVPYPSTPQNVQPNMQQTPTDTARWAVLHYGLDQWNAARIDAEVAMAAAWAKEHGVRLTCNEFGAFREYSDPNARAAWLRDVRSTLEKYGIGWTMWDYQGGFGVVRKENGHTTPDALVLNALGLHMPGVK